MADTLTEKSETAAPVASSEEAPASGAKTVAEKQLPTKDADKPEEEEAPKKETKDAEEPKESKTAEKLVVIASKKPDDSETANAEDNEVKDTAADDEAETAAAAETPAAKSKNRRKSTSDSKGKSLSRKNSKARLTHLHAQPGEHFLVKLKGFPAWPAIICNEAMLPAALVSSRPVSAARPDGTYAEAYADGGKRVHDRTYPAMYLHTNEFGWVGNTALTELSAEKAKDMITDKMRKDLKAAFELAVEQNSIDHYQEILQKFQDELLAQEAKKEAAATPKKSKKGKAAKASSEYDDVDMADAEESAKPKPKKRKADDVSTPQRSESVKKPKIKLNTSTTPKTANGTPSAKSKEAAAAKAGKAKAKAKKGKETGDKNPEAEKEANMTPEERHLRKERELMFLRHRLQRGLLAREQPPREDEMETMSGFITILENFPDPEASIIRATKINKVLKAILKLSSIPHEEEFNFKKRSQSLLDEWNKLLASDGAAPAASNGVNGASEANATEKQSGANGVKDDAKDGSKDDAKDSAKETESDKVAEDVAASAKEKAGNENSKGEEEGAEKENDQVDEEMVSAGPEPVESAA